MGYEKCILRNQVILQQCEQLLKPSLFNFPLRELGNEWSQNFYLVSFRFRISLNKIEPIMRIPLIANHTPTFLNMERHKVQCMGIFITPEMIILTVHLTRKMKPCFVCEESDIRDFLTFLSKNILKSNAILYSTLMI